MFAAEIRKRRVCRWRGYPPWRWLLDEAVKSYSLSPIEENGDGPGVSLKKGERR